MTTFINSIAFAALLLLSITAQATTINSSQNGDWLSTSRWDLGRTPNDNDTIRIWHNIEISGDNIYLNNALIIIENGGNLFMDNSGLSYANLILTGTGGVIVRSGGSINEGAILDQFLTITLNGIELWNGDTHGNVNGPLFLPASLPVEYKEFSASTSGENVTVSWTTAMEKDNDHFTLERSLDGESWKEISIVNGVGNSNTLINYTATDEKPEPGTNYYRLKQTDIDGTHSYSSIISVEYYSTKVGEFNIYPNPATEHFNIEIHNFDPNEEVLVTVINSMGEQFYSKILITDMNGNGFLGVDADNRIPPGIYHVTGTDKNHLMQQKLVIR